MIKPALIVSTLLALLVSVDATNNNTILIHTDDTGILRNLNIKPILDLADYTDTRNISFDGTGLKLGGMHFHHSPDSLQVIKEAAPANQTVNKLSMDDGSANTCTMHTCYTDRKVSFKSQYQQSAFSGTACTYIIPRIQGKIGGSGISLWWNNAKCDSDDVPCSLWFGVTVAEPTTTANKYLLLRYCQTTFTSLANACTLQGGVAVCTLSNHGGSFKYWDMAFDTPMMGFDCNHSGKWKTMKCGHATCSKDDGYCSI